MDSKIYNAYKTVVESQIPNQVDEDEEGRANILSEIANGLKDILEKIENYNSRSSSTKSIKIPDNPEDVSWLPSTR
jgi:hypothetical protein